MEVGIFFLCSPDCPKQPRTSFPFYKFFYTTISCRISGSTENLQQTFWKYAMNLLKIIGNSISDSELDYILFFYWQTVSFSNRQLCFMYNFNAKKLAQYLLKVREGRRELAYDISHKINYTGSDIFAEVSNEQLCNKREMINQQLLYLYGLDCLPEFGRVIFQWSLFFM